MKCRVFFLGLAASVVVSASAFAGEVSLPDYHLAVTLPDGWKQMPDQTKGILLRAQSVSGDLRFAFTRPPIPMPVAPVQNAGFQKGIKQSLIDHGFSKIIRDEVIKVAGSDAYLCEAVREDK